MPWPAQEEPRTGQDEEAGVEGVEDASSEEEGPEAVVMPLEGEREEEQGGGKAAFAAVGDEDLPFFDCPSLSQSLLVASAAAAGPALLAGEAPVAVTEEGQAQEAAMGSHESSYGSVTGSLLDLDEELAEIEEQQQEQQEEQQDQEEEQQQEEEEEHDEEEDASQLIDAVLTSHNGERRLDPAAASGAAFPATAPDSRPPLTICSAPLLCRSADVPFDYVSGFNRAMSTSHMTGSGPNSGALPAAPSSPGGASSDSEWTLVTGAAESEEPYGPQQRVREAGEGGLPAQELLI
jgi:hypothetical protein